MLVFLVSSDLVSLGCLAESTGLQQYRVDRKFTSWQQCRNECAKQRKKVSFVPSLFAFESVRLRTGRSLFFEQQSMWMHRELL